MQVEIEVAVVVAVHFVVDGGVGHAEPFVDAGHEVGRLLDDGVGQCLFQVVERRLVVANRTIAGGQRAVGTGYLVDVAVCLEQLQRPLCQTDGQLVGICQPLGVDHRQSAVEQLVAGRCRRQVFGNGLKGIGHEVGEVVALGYLVAAQQVVHLLLVDVVGRPFGEYASGADVVEVVQELGRVALHLLGVDGHECLDRLLVEAYIIIIGGSDDGQFGLGIEQASLLALAEQMALLVDALQAVDGPFTIVVEVLGARTALAEAHLLDVADEQFQLVVGDFGNAVEHALRTVVFHLGNVPERLVVQSLSVAICVADGVETAVMIGI